MNAADLPDIARARLPVNYSAACSALSQCHRIDECKDWANKAEALASYARQSKDDSLRKTADRIQARAVRRCGELLRSIEPPKNQHDKEARASRGVPTSRADVAREAGLSKDQRVTAMRVANIEPSLFESQVESNNPPTVTTLAEQGKKPQPRKLVDLGNVDPADFQAATQAAGWVHQLCDVISADHLTPVKVARGFLPHDKTVEQFRADLMTLGSWAAAIISIIGDK
jgi:hypothetical protein